MEISLVQSLELVLPSVRKPGSAGTCPWLKGRSCQALLPATSPPIVAAFRAPDDSCMQSSVYSNKWHCYGLFVSE